MAELQTSTIARCGLPYIEDTHQVIKVPLNRIAGLWEHVHPFLAIGFTIAAPELNQLDVIEGLNDESIQLWVAVGGDTEICAAFLTSVERDRMDWVVSLYALGGMDVKHWLGACDAAMTAFAKQEGAVRVRMCGRKAWKRLLPATFRITGQRGGHNVYERDVP